MSHGKSLYMYEKRGKTVSTFSNVEFSKCVEHPINLKEKAIPCLETTDEIQYLNHHYDQRAGVYKFILVDEELLIKELVEDRGKLVIKRERFVHQNFATGSCSKKILMRDDILYDYNLVC